MSVYALPDFTGLDARAKFGLSARSIIYVTLLFWIAAYFLAWPIWRAHFLLEIWPTEEWNAYLQDAAVSGGVLYPPADALTGNNYPPLSFFAIGYLGKLFGDSLYVGRFVSLASLAVLSLEVFIAIRLLAPERRLGAAVGALWLLAMMAHTSILYVGANDPQIAGEAIMGAALVWFLDRERRGGSMLAPLLLMVVAGFWKHNMIAIPLTAITWLFICDAKKAIRPVLLAVIAALAGLVFCTAVFGIDFLHGLLAVRSYAVSNVLGNIGHLQWCAAAFAIWSAWALSDRGKPVQFTSLHIFVSLFSCLFQWFGHGVGVNAEFDLIFALAIGVGIAFCRADATWLARRIGTERTRDIAIALLLLRLLVSDRQEPALMIFNPEFRSMLADREAAAIEDIRRVFEIEGDVACSIKIICRAAGKAYVVDEFKTEELTKTERMTTLQVQAAMKAKNITPFENNPLARAGGDTSLLRWILQK